MRYIQLEPDAQLPDLSDTGPFKIVIAVEDAVSQVRQNEICAWAVEMGCRYVMVCGKGCESWCDAVRAANLAAFEASDLKPEDFVMATSHANESLKSVFWFAKKAANHPEVMFKELVVLHLGERDRSLQYKHIYQRA